MWCDKQAQPFSRIQQRLPATRPAKCSDKIVLLCQYLNVMLQEETQLASLDLFENEFALHPPVEQLCRMQGVMGRRGGRHSGNLAICITGLKPPTSGCGLREVSKAVQEGPAETIQTGFTVTARLSGGRVLKRPGNLYKVGRKKII